MRTTKFDDVIAFPRLSEAQIERARKYQAAILSDVAGRRGALHSSIKPLRNDMQVVGTAFTVESRPGDNLMFHVALALAKPGDVIVVAGQGYASSAMFGELMVTQAEAAGIGGFVVDGASRDFDTIGNSRMPIFAAGRNPAGPTKNIGGKICCPISLGDVAVQPGDLVVGDCDGVVVIPRQEVDIVLEAAEKKVQAEQERMKEIEQGILVSPWLDDALRAAGVIAANETLM
ncbi:RraA family protein [Klebsiella pneumoniae]